MRHLLRKSSTDNSCQRECARESERAIAANLAALARITPLQSENVLVVCRCRRRCFVVHVKSSVCGASSSSSWPGPFMRCCLTSAGAFALHAVSLSIFPSRSRTGFRRLCDRCFSLLFVYVLCTRREVNKRTRTTTSNRRFFWFGWAFSCAQIALNKKLFGQGLIIII